MKRAREVEEGARYFGGLRDAGHHYGNMAVELLSNGDILQTMLRERPYTLMQLLSSAKVLYGLLQHVSGFWFAVLNSVIVKETGETNWAFYAWEWHTGQMRHWMARVLEWQRDATLYDNKAPFFAYLRLFINVERPATGDEKEAVTRYRRQMPWVGDDRYLLFELGNYAPIDFWNYDDVQGWTPDNGGAEEAEQREYDQIRAMVLTPEYRGRGADILATGNNEEARSSTSLCEIAGYRMRDESHDGDADPPTPLSVLSRDARQALCRIYTYFHPFALGPFELLDTRRLWLHRLYLAFLLEGGEWVTYVFNMEQTPWDDKYNVLRRHRIHSAFYGQWVAGMAEIARWSMTRENGAVHEDSADWDMEQHMQGADEAVVARIQKACDDVAHIGAITGMMPAAALDTPKPDLTQTRALLAEGMPDAGVMLELAPYAQQMRQRYAEPGAARRLLEREMRYLERAKGGAYMVQQYGRRVNVQ